MLKVKCLEAKKLATNALFSRFAIGPLRKSQGLTIGNALRRVLLSDLQGIAISNVRIEGVDHEFSTILDVKEEIIDILLNLKQISLKGLIEDPLWARLEYRGPGIITAKDIKLPPEIKLVEPNQYIATVTANRVIAMEFLIQKGTGYSLQTSSANDLEGFLPIDAVYMPVRKVNFFIETINADLASNFESLILEVSTNGSIEPKQAVVAASQILQTIFSSLQLNEFPLKTPFFSNNEHSPKKTINIFEVTPIEELELSVRAFNCLKRANVHTLADLLKYSQAELLEFKNFGQKSAEEVTESLRVRFDRTLR